MRKVFCVMNRKYILNASTLKCIAICSMLLDHIGIMLAGTEVNQVVYYALRGIGRLAFPIFCFLLVEGFVHTHSYIKYIIRMLLLAFISEIPYDLLNFGNIVNLTHNNILFTFVIALGMLFLISKCVNKGSKEMLLTLVIVTGAAALTICLKTEYSWRCIFIVAFLYIVRSNFVMRNITVAIVLLIDTTITGIMALFSLIFINGYNGEKGRLPNWVGYAFYPVHLIVLWAIDGFII